MILMRLQQVGLVKKWKNIKMSLVINLIIRINYNLFHYIKKIYNKKTIIVNNLI